MAKPTRARAFELENGSRQSQPVDHMMVTETTDSSLFDLIDLNAPITTEFSDVEPQIAEPEIQIADTRIGTKGGRLASTALKNIMDTFNVASRKKGVDTIRDVVHDDRFDTHFGGRDGSLAHKVSDYMDGKAIGATLEDDDIIEGKEPKHKQDIEILNNSEAKRAAGWDEDIIAAEEAELKKWLVENYGAGAVQKIKYAYNTVEHKVTYKDRQKLVSDIRRLEKNAKRIASGQDQSDEVPADSSDVSLVEPAVLVHAEAIPRPEIGDKRGWELYLHRKRLLKMKTEKGFFAPTNKEAGKIQKFDKLTYDGDILKWMDMIYKNNHNLGAMESRIAAPNLPETLRHPDNDLVMLVTRFDGYAHDALDRIDGADYILDAADEKSNKQEMFKDAFPIDDWMRDNPDNILRFMNLSDYQAMKQFVAGTEGDFITKRARSKKELTTQDQIEWITSKMGTLNVAELHDLAQELKDDQTSRLTYWIGILEKTRVHGFVREFVDHKVAQLHTLTPRPKEQVEQTLKSLVSDSLDETPF